MFWSQNIEEFNISVWCETIAGQEDVRRDFREARIWISAPGEMLVTDDTCLSSTIWSTTRNFSRLSAFWPDPSAACPPTMMAWSGYPSTEDRHNRPTKLRRPKDCLELSRLQRQEQMNKNYEAKRPYWSVKRSMGRDCPAFSTILIIWESIVPTTTWHELNMPCFYGTQWFVQLLCQ